MTSLCRDCHTNPTYRHPGGKMLVRCLPCLLVWRAAPRRPEYTCRECGRTTTAKSKVCLRCRDDRPKDVGLPDFANAACWSSEHIFDAAIDNPSDRIHFLAAKAFCDQCPIASRCLDYGIATKQTGVWGGVQLDNGKRYRHIGRPRRNEVA